MSDNRRSHKPRRDSAVYDWDDGAADHLGENREHEKPLTKEHHGEETREHHREGREHHTPANPQHHVKAGPEHPGKVSALPHPGEALGVLEIGREARKKSRKPARHEIKPDSPLGRALGLDDREIPGGLNHIANPETYVTKAAVPVTEHLKAGEAHGVAPESPDEPWAVPQAEMHVMVPEPVHLSPEDAAVPVYVVETPGKGKVRRDAAAEQIKVPASGSDPIRVCSVDAQRVQISLLNNDANNDVQFSESLSTVVEGRGAILPHAATSYRTLRTQGELWALGTTANAVTISKIIETEVSA